MSPRAGNGDVEKRSNITAAGNATPAIQSVVRHYAYYPDSWSDKKLYVINYTRVVAFQTTIMLIFSDIN
jgi:hypothetical protein